jgi:glycosyltransferase involved in cell wall biosynthesis
MKQGKLGLLPGVGGGLTSLSATGQAGRLTDYYFPAYLNVFEHLFYFSYHQESLADYTQDPTLLKSVTLVPPPGRLPYRVYAFLLPFLASSMFRTCGTLRAFQATGAIPAMIARLLYGVPYVTTYGYRYHAVAALDGRRLSDMFLRLLEPLALRLAAGVIVTTQELASYVRDSVPAAKIHLIPNGVDTALFAPSERARERSGAARTILFVGRLTRQKNLTRLLQALSVLSRRHAIQLHVIGDGPLQRELERMASRLQVHCFFEGPVPHRNLPEHMNQADLFVLPSLVEGHPKALIEAMSCAMACAVSNCEGNRALIRHEVTGLLFEPSSLEQMIAQIERALTDWEASQAFGQAARRHVCAEYDLHRLLEQETALLQTVASRRAT